MQIMQNHLQKRAISQKTSYLFRTHLLYILNENSTHLVGNLSEITVPTYVNKYMPMLRNVVFNK